MKGIVDAFKDVGFIIWGVPLVKKSGTEIAEVAVRFVAILFHEQHGSYSGELISMRNGSVLSLRLNWR